MKKQSPDQEQTEVFDKSTGVSRRRFVQGAAASGAFLGSSIVTMPQLLKAAEGDDEHFFIFLELHGGVHWMLATDGRDLSQLPLTNPAVCRPFKLTDDPPGDDVVKFLYQEDQPSFFGRDTGELGKLILLPYIDDLQNAFKKGQTTTGSDYILGFCADALAEHVNDIAVLRGVHMFSTFHGEANDEIFSGQQRQSNHLAGVVAKHLEEKYGPKLLDNLVFERAAYTENPQAKMKPMVPIDGSSLGYLLGTNELVSGTTMQNRFTTARIMADSIAKSANLSPAHRQIFNSYISAMTNSNVIRSRLMEISSQLSEKDASLDLDLQFKTALSVIEGGLTRVVTLCLGKSNGKNMVDGFGLFDAHSGVYFLDQDNEDTANSQRHHRNVRSAMEGIARFIKQLKSKPFKDTGKTMFDVTTVVVGTEFARPSNFMGNESSGPFFGNGHNWYNNNYILFGKGVKGGNWIGKTDPIRQTGFVVDFSTIENSDPNQVAMTPHEYDFEAQEENGSDENGEGTYSIRDYQTSGDKRPFMARDLTRTVVAIAGAESSFTAAYPQDGMKDAKVIKSLIK